MHSSTTFYIDKEHFFLLVACLTLPNCDSGIEDPLVACCGGGGPYGVSASAGCGYGEYKVCDDPSKYASWDGFHPSEAAYKGIAIGLLQGPYTQPPIASITDSCLQIIGLGSSAERKVIYDM